MCKRQVVIGMILSVILALSASTVLAATRTVTIQVKGMTCGGYAASLEKALKNTEGVSEARVSYARGEAWIKYDDQKVTIAKLREAINNAGYEAVPVTAGRRSKRSRSARQKSTPCCDAISCET